MAGLNGGEFSGGERRRRAQLLLVGAFGLAVLLLVLAGVLNTVTYTESLATQSGSHDSRDVAAFQNDTRRAIWGIVARVNRNESVSEKSKAVTRSIANWSSAVSREHAMDVTGVDVSVTDTVNGTRITQVNSSTFTNATGASNWTLATGVSNTRLFRMNVSQASLASSCDAGCFTVVVDNGTTTWNVSLVQSELIVDGPGTRDGSCGISTDPVLVNVTAGTINGQDCDPLSFAAGLTGSYNISYRNGTNARGTYRLTVDGIAEAGNYATDGSPSYAPAVYAVYAQVTYRTARLDYGTTIRVARGEPDD